MARWEYTPPKVVIGLSLRPVMVTEPLPASGSPPELKLPRSSIKPPHAAAEASTLISRRRSCREQRLYLDCWGHRSATQRTDGASNYHTLGEERIMIHPMRRPHGVELSRERKGEVLPWILLHLLSILSGPPGRNLCLMEIPRGVKHQ